eukprot:UN34640
MSAASASKTPVCRYYLRMRGLPWGTSTKDIMDFFKGVEIQTENIMILKMPNGKDSGEGLVGFKEQASYDKAMTFEKKYIQNRYIELYPSAPEEWTRIANRTDRVLPAPINPNSYVVHMRGLPFSVHEDDCLAFFKGVSCLGVHLTKDGLGRPSGQGYAEFETAEAFSNAMTFNKSHIHNRYIELFESNVEELVGAVTRTQPTTRNTPSRSSRSSNSAPSYNQPYSSATAGQVPTCIHMRGLPYNSTEDDITRFFAEGQGVTPSRIHRKADGTEAFAEFRTFSEGELAMKQNKKFMGR